MYTHMTKKAAVFLGALAIAASAQANEISKGQWIEGMKTALPTAFCSSAQYFRQCFDVTATQCEEVAASATRVCLSDIEQQLPNVLVQPQDGYYWGTKVGECAGTTYELTLISQRVNSDICNDVTAWQ